MLAQTTPARSNHDVASCGHGQPQWLVALGWVGVVWYVVVTVVCMVGWVQIIKHYSRVPRRSVSTTALPRAQVPHATIIRPVKGLEPYLYECLASSMHQDYPRDKITVHLCVSSAKDPALPTLRRLVRDFPDSNLRIFIEDEGTDDDLGPNPKIRNMSRAYREAKGDIVWIIDSNVWVAKGVCGRMVDKLCGFSPGGKSGRRYKFVHHLPLVVDVDGGAITKDEETSGLLDSYNGDIDMETPGLAPQLERRSWASILATGGGRLEELFLSSAHAKMYSAINTVLVAPCTVGKSSMFRKSHLDYLTSPAGLPPPRPHSRRPGIDFFSDNICEDHLIGDRLWKGKVFEEREKGERWGKHSIIFGDLAIQPISGMSVGSYFDRRVRWLRVRKFTVTLATLVEPGTESFLCSLYLAFGVTTVFPSHFPQHCSLLSSWTAFVFIWVLSILSWIAVDWTVYLLLHSAKTIEVDEHTPPFTRPLPSKSISRRPFVEWLCGWLGREALALPIWVWAVYGGSRVVWRDRTFRVGMDMIVHEIAANNKQPSNGSTERRANLTRSSGSTSSHEDTEIRRRSPSGVRNRVQLD